VLAPALRTKIAITRVAIVMGLAAGATHASAEEASWATTQARELTRQGEAHAARGDSATAMRRLLEAVSLDPSFGSAYLALAALHEASGDSVEAERVYAVGLERVAGFAEGHLARGKLRKKLGRLREAAADFEAASSLAPEDASALEGLASTYVALGAWPAALAVSRRIEAIAAARGDAAALKEARTRSRALAALVAEADPVTAGAHDRGPVRSALAKSARRGR
jgi:tetratricopeptide (TPR) repeat protein